MTEPSLGEVVRRLTDVVTRLDQLAVKFEQAQARAEDRYVTKEFYSAEMREVRKDVYTLEEARKTDQGWRRQASFQTAVTAISLLVTITLALVTILTR